MQARLFFAMLSHGRAIERRKNYRLLFELLHVSTYPHYTAASQEEVRDYFYDSSLSAQDIAMRRQVLIEAEEKAREQQVFDPPTTVLRLFSGARRGLP